MTRLAIALCACLLLPAAAEAPRPLKGGFWQHETGLHYKVHTPRGKARPGLLIVCHGQTGLIKPLESLYAKACTAAGYVVVFPRSIAASRDAKTTDPRWAEEDDKKLVKLTRDLSRWYRVDRTRIYGLGIGNGNIIGNLAFTHPTLFNGAIGLIGGPGMIGGTYAEYTDAMKKRLGLLLLVANPGDPGRQGAEDSEAVAKKAGITDVTLREFKVSRGKTTLQGSGGPAAEWLRKDRWAFVAGEMASDIRWGRTAADEGTLVYVVAEGKKHLAASMVLEFDVLGAPHTIARARSLNCKKLSLKDKDPLLAKLGRRGKAPKGPVVAFLDKGGAVKLTLDARAVETLWKKARGRSYEQKWPKFAEALEAQITGAVGKGSGGELK